jgi:hypothetical protein
MVCSNQPTDGGRSPQAGRATLASHQAPAGLGHAEGIPNAVKAQLPKARLVRFGWRWPYIGRFFLKTRGANFAAIWFGPFKVSWRMPWLTRPAMQLHPHLFKPRDSDASLAEDRAAG